MNGKKVIALLMCALMIYSFTFPVPPASAEELEGEFVGFELISTYEDEYAVIAWREDGTVGGMGIEELFGEEAAEILALTDVVDIINASYMADDPALIALRSDGTVYMTEELRWRYEDYLSWENVAEIENCGASILVRHKDGTVQGTDWTDVARLDFGLCSMGGFYYAVRNDGQVYQCFYDDRYRSFENFAIGLEGVKDIFRSSNEIWSVVKEDGTVARFLEDRGIEDIDLVYDRLERWVVDENGERYRLNDMSVEKQLEEEIAGWRDIVQVVSTQIDVAGLRKDGTLVVATSEGPWSEMIHLNGLSGIRELWCGDFPAQKYDLPFAIMEDGRVVPLVPDGALSRPFFAEICGWTDVEALYGCKDAIACLRTDGSVGISVREGCEWLSGQKNEIESWRDVVSLHFNEGFLAGRQSDGNVLYAFESEEVRETLPADDIIQVSESYAYHMCVYLTSDGTLLAPDYAENVREEAESWTGVVKVIAYDDYYNNNIIALFEDGSVRTAGSAWLKEYLEGEEFIMLQIYRAALIGIGKNGTVSAIAGGWSSAPENIVSVASSGAISVALKADGTVAVDNSHNFHNEKEFEYVSSWTDIKQLRVGMTHVLGLKTDGTIVHSTEAVDERDRAPGYDPEYLQEIKSWKDIDKLYFGPEGNYDDGLLIGIKNDGTWEIWPDRYDPAEFAPMLEWGKVSDLKGKLSIGIFVALSEDGTILTHKINTEW